MMRLVLIVMGFAALAACGRAAAPDASTASAAAEILEMSEAENAEPGALEDIAPDQSVVEALQPAAGGAADAIDPNLAGVWVNEDMLSSGGADFASLITVMTMQLRPDGTIAQYTESAGGGGEWSYDGGRTLDFEGEWRADGRTLYVKGMGLTEFTAAATYEFSGEYLVTQSDQGRLIWQRQ